MAGIPTIWLESPGFDFLGLAGGGDSTIVATASGFSAFWTANTAVFPSPDNIVHRAFGLDGVGIGFESEADSFVGQGTGSQDSPAVASYPGMGSVLVYRNTFQGTTSIWAVKYDANGANPKAFWIGADASAGGNPSVVMFNDGSFAVTYQAPGSFAHPDLVARYIGANGDIGNRFIVASDIANFPDLQTALLSDGSFVVAYSQDVGGNLDTNAKIVQAGGNVVHATVATTGNAETEAHVAGLTGGGFVVVYTYDTGSDKNVRFALRDNSGVIVPVGDDVVNTFTLGDQEHPAVTGLQDGGFLVVWYDAGQIFEQRFAANGSKIGTGASIWGAGHVADELSATELADGRVVVTWTDVDAGLPSYTILDPRGAVYNGNDGGNDFIATRREGGTVNGLGGNDTIQGFEGQDLIFGGAGNDTLSGGANADTLTGGTGRDVMTGGTERDVFDFNAVNETGKTAATRDLITDFHHLKDRIDVFTIDANGPLAGNARFAFLAAKGAAFTGVKGQIHWFQQNPAGTVNDKTIVEGDINGDKHADFAIELKGLIALSAADFLL